MRGRVESAGASRWNESRGVPMPRTKKATGPALIAAAMVLAASRGAAKHGPPVYAPVIDPKNFVTTVDHPFFPLVPGTVLRSTEREGGRVRLDEMTVLHDTRVVLGVTCTVVHDVLKDGDRVVEDTDDWYAQDRQGNVWYFGEDTKEFSPRGRVSTAGSWSAGVNGGRPGIMMPALITPGRTYRQEYRPGVAEDMGQIVAVGESVTVPAGTYTGCVKTKDWSRLEAGYEFKWYARGIGCVRSESSSREISELRAVTKP